MNNLEERTFQFAINTIKMCNSLPSSNSNKIISNQLIRSSTSIGANYREAQNAFSKNDFKYKISICQKECAETIYWLQILQGLKLQNDKISGLNNESIELLKIIRTISIKLKK